MPGPASTQMTAHKTADDATVRTACAAYKQRRVDIRGRALPFDPTAPSVDAEWTRHNLARVRASLPYSDCDRPP